MRASTTIEQHRQGNPPRKWDAHGMINQFAVPTTLIAGPPGSGKTTYVKEHASSGDVIIDVDSLFVALSGRPPHEHPPELLSVVLDAREAAECRLFEPIEVGHAWILRGTPKRLQRQYYEERGASVIVLEVDADECLERVLNDPQRNQSAQHWISLIAKWWADYEKGF